MTGSGDCVEEIVKGHFRKDVFEFLGDIDVVFARTTVLRNILQLALECNNYYVTPSDNVGIRCAMNRRVQVYEHND